MQNDPTKIDDNDVRKIKKLQIETEKLMLKYPGIKIRVIEIMEDANKQAANKGTITNIMKKIPRISSASGNWKIRKTNIGDVNDECPICLNKFIEGQTIITHNNSHKMHKLCFAETAKDECPLDREPFTGFDNFGKKRSKKRSKKFSKKQSKKQSKKRSKRRSLR
jgi:hypothetical protein